MKKYPGIDADCSGQREENGLFREIHTPQTECGPSQKTRGARVWGCQFLWAG